MRVHLENENNMENQGTPQSPNWQQIWEISGLLTAYNEVLIKYKIHIHIQLESRNMISLSQA